MTGLLAGLFPPQSVVLSGSRPFPWLSGEAAQVSRFCEFAATSTRHSTPLRLVPDREKGGREAGRLSSRSGAGPSRCLKLFGHDGSERNLIGQGKPLGHVSRDTRFASTPVFSWKQLRALVRPSLLPRRKYLEAPHPCVLTIPPQYPRAMTAVRRAGKLISGYVSRPPKTM